MSLISLYLFFIPLTLLVGFLSYKAVELIIGREIAFSRYLRSYDSTLRGLVVFSVEVVFSFKKRSSLFFLTRMVYPLQRAYRRVKFRIDAWYFHFLERLRQRYISRYRKQIPLYLNISSSKDPKSEDGKGKPDPFISGKGDTSGVGFGKKEKRDRS